MFYHRGLSFCALFSESREIAERCLEWDDSTSSDVARMFATMDKMRSTLKNYMYVTLSITYHESFSMPLAPVQVEKSVSRDWDEFLSFSVDMILHINHCAAAGVNNTAAPFYWIHRVKDRVLLKKQALLVMGILRYRERDIPRDIVYCVGLAICPPRNQLKVEGANK